MAYPLPAQTLGLAHVLDARERVAGIATVTPLKPSETLSAKLEGMAGLKPETMQPTGAFKVRGAVSRMLCLRANETARGVITAALSVLLRDVPNVPLPTVANLTGDNIDPAQHLRVICGAQCQAARTMDAARSHP